jgi:tetratricopeptide (TPR) repeat protein
VEVAIAKRELAKAEELARNLPASGASANVGREILGQVHFAQGRYAEAIEELSRALTDNPGSERTLTFLVQSFVAAKQHDRGISYLKKFIAGHEDNALAHELIGEMSVLAGDLKSAGGYYQRSTEISGDTATYLRYGRVLVRTGHNKQAVTAFQTALKSDPESDIGLFDLAVALQKAGDVNSAISTYRRILSRNSNLDAAANNLASLLADFRYQDSEALQEALALADRFQTSNAAYYLDTLGWIHYRMGNLPNAIAVLERASRSGQRIPVLHYHLGMAYLAAKQNDRAKEHLLKATEGDPNYVGIDVARQTLAKL